LDSRIAYTLWIALIAGERLLELRICRRHQRWLRARGAIEHGAEQYPWMVGLHATFLAACLLEVWVRHPRPIPALVAASGLALLGALALRWWVIATLGPRWSTRVLVLPGEPLVRHGPYRFARHPNYAAVAVEMAALPLLHTAVLTAAVFGLLNAGMLVTRIRVEDRALRAVGPPRT
jgi:methyltransferase